MPTATTTSSKTTSTPTTMAALSEVVLLIGGDGYARGTGVEVWGPSCRHLLPPLPFSRHGAEAVQKSGEVVLCGGGRFGPNCLSLSKSLHWKTFTGRGWTPVTQTRACLCLASLDQGMVMHTGGPDNTAWLWHPGVGEGWWERIADLPHRLYAHACTYQPEEGRVVIAGGSDGFEVRRETYSYQLASGHWQRGPDLLMGQHGGYGWSCHNIGRRGWYKISALRGTATKRRVAVGGFAADSAQVQLCGCCSPERFGSREIQTFGCSLYS